MHNKITKLLLALWLISSLIVSGCGQLRGQAPIVSISDPGVYTSLHLYAARKHIERHMNSQKGPNDPNDSFSVMDDMVRYFRETPDNYKKKRLRMDEMLDDTQRISDALHIYETVTRFNMRYSPLGIRGYGEPLATNLIPSSLFSLSTETQKKLKAAENVQKVVKKKEFELKEAEATLTTASASVRDANNFLANKNRDLGDKKLEKKNLEVDFEIADANADYWEGKAQGAEDRLQKDPNNSTLAMDANMLRIKADDAKDNANKLHIETLEIKKSLAISEDEVEKAQAKLKKEEDKEEIKVANKKVDDAKKALNEAKNTFETKQKEAKDAQAKEVEHPFSVLRPKLAGLVSDSPFDRLDRARDFYASYILKTLRSFGDSRAIDPCSIAKHYDEVMKNSKGIKDSNSLRLLLVAFQVHVDPGTRSNYMVGLRVIVKDVENNKQPKKYGPSDVKVIQLHPTRAYDIDDQLFLEKINAASGFSFSGSVTGIKDELNFLREERNKSEARRSFLSRISKIASFADAGRHEFGWNFYPSNLVVEKRGLIQSFGEWFKSGPSGDYVVNAYLEGGARDCSAYILVPYDVNEIKLGVEYIIKSVAGGELNRHERRYHIDNEHMRRQVDWLKKPSGIENMIKCLSWLFVSEPEFEVISSKETSEPNYAYVTLTLSEKVPKKYERAAAFLLLSEPKPEPEPES